MALSANSPLTFIRGEQSEASVYQAVTIYEGAMLGDVSGYARPLTAGDPFRGHAVEYIDNSAGASGALAVTIMRGRYRLEVTLTGVLITDQGSPVYASDDATLTLTAGANSRVGVVERYVTTNTAIVEFQMNEMDETVSDLTTLISDLKTVQGTSDFNTLQSDVTTLKSDNVVNKSDLLFTASDTKTNKSDIVVIKSDVTTGASNTTTNLSDLRVGISDAKLAHTAGDWVNVSDIKVSIAEIIAAISDALG